MSNVTIIESVDLGEDADFTIPPGDYYVGDPCYVLPDDLYDALHEFIFTSRDAANTIHVSVPLDDGEIANIVDMRTRHGDGRYAVQSFRRGMSIPARGVAVDSGGIAIIDKRLCIKGKCEDAVAFAAFVTLDKPTAVQIRNQNMTIVSVLYINTDGEDEDEGEKSQ